ncbi:MULTISPECIES: N-acetylmuramic acid 6-phosphate etherase [Chelativorans]|uniref:SIS domain-containing protein n=1 Tax=Chelativorans sp. (strain BNC1) TaxID=266779 RepID=Q11ED4_CHESB|nr:MULTISPECIES: N-acetylmuramic acid 6-phosphate etherase [Chelativorans]
MVSLHTESTGDRYRDLELAPDGELLRMMLDGQKNAFSAVSDALPALESALAAMVKRLRGSAGRLFYVGAGTSGRLAVLDALELGPTFSWPDERLVLLLAGGLGLAGVAEAAEDDIHAAVRAIENAGCGHDDVILALAASGTTPYTLAAVEAARKCGALTIGLANNPGAPLLGRAEIGILLDTGPEAVAGSTRLAAGTSQKIALNLLSTALMARLGKVFRGQMVDMKAANDKLHRRAATILVEISGCSREEAVAALEKTGYRLKPAVLVLKGMEPSAAEAALERHGGDLHAVLGIKTV